MNQRLVEPFPRHRSAVTLRSHDDGFFRAAIGDEYLFRPQLAQMLQGQLAHLARTDNQDGLVAEMIEYLTNVVNRNAGNRNVSLTDPRFGSGTVRPRG